MVYEFMNKSLALIPVAFAIFALMLTPAVMSVSADKGGNGKAQGSPQGCENGKGEDNVQNPNCNSIGDSDGDGIPNNEDACPNMIPVRWEDGQPDHDGDGQLDIDDLEPCGS